MSRKGILLATLLLSASSSIWAQDFLKPRLNEVSMRLNAEHWVETKTALVRVIVNAAINDQSILKMQDSVLSKLQKFSPSAEWHITSLNRRQDSSGLESIQLTTQARLSQSDLAGIRKKAKDLSKPGETYKIGNISFRPSEAENRQADSLLRAKIYKQASTELDKLNAAYPKQQYFVHRINFNGGPVMMAESRMMMAKGADMVASSSMSVDNKARMMATVVFASKLPEGNS